MSPVRRITSKILLLLLLVASHQIHTVSSFSSTPGFITRYTSVLPSSCSWSGKTSTTLCMAKGEKKKRRRRKNAPQQQQQEQQEQQQQQSSTQSSPLDTFIPDDDIIAAKELSQSGAQASIDDLKAIANFQAPSSSGAIDNIVSPPIPDSMNTGTGAGTVGGLDSDSVVELPDIRDALKNKELKRIEEEEAQKQQRPKISRKDTKAFLELLEAEPFADADDSYFEDEEYGTVSALLGEGAKSFLGIPPGPLQVGHFIGSLGIFLCAFIDYPGFPLTNLPTPLRDALQGGLGVIYLINTLLAVLAVFKANERGQSPALWAVKTFSVGGLALDQLTQLPTLKQVEEMKNRKGARALKNRKK